jgi:hypothetical protein
MYILPAKWYCPYWIKVVWNGKQANILISHHCGEIVNYMLEVIKKYEAMEETHIIEKNIVQTFSGLFSHILHLTINIFWW